MVLNPQKIFNDAGVTMYIRRGGDDRLELIEKAQKEILWGEWLKDESRPTRLKLFLPGAPRSKEVTMVDDGEKPWGLQLSGDIGNQRIKVGGGEGFQHSCYEEGRGILLEI